MIREYFDKELLESVLLAAKMLDYNIEETGKSIKIRKPLGNKISLSFNKRNSIDLVVKDGKFRPYMEQRSLKKQRDIDNALKILLEVL